MTPQKKEHDFPKFGVDFLKKGVDFFQKVAPQIFGLHISLFFRHISGKPNVSDESDKSDYSDPSDTPSRRTLKKVNRLPSARKKRRKGCKIFAFSRYTIIIIN